MGLREQIAARLSALEGFVAAQQRPTGWDAHYTAHWREHHLAQAAALHEPEAEVVEAEVRQARQLEAQREQAKVERATADAAERQRAWQVERARILSERARLRRAAEEAGQQIFLATGEPPTTPPDWFMPAHRDGAVTVHRPSTPQRTQRAPDGMVRLDLPGWDAVAGRPAQRGPELEHPEDALRRQAKEKHR